MGPSWWDSCPNKGNEYLSTTEQENFRPQARKRILTRILTNQPVPWPWTSQASRTVRNNVHCLIHRQGSLSESHPSVLRQLFLPLGLILPFIPLSLVFALNCTTCSPLTWLLRHLSEFCLSIDFEDLYQLLQRRLSCDPRIPHLAPTTGKPNHPTPFTGISNC